MSLTLADVEKGENENGDAPKAGSPKTFFKKNKMVIYAAGGVILLIGAYWAYNKVIQKTKSVAAPYVAPKPVNITPPITVNPTM